MHDFVSVVCVKHSEDGMCVARTTHTPFLLCCLSFFRHNFGLREEQQVVSATGLRVCAGHVEAAKWMDTDERTGTFAIEVQVANEEVLPGFLNALRVARVE